MGLWAETPMLHPRRRLAYGRTRARGRVVQPLTVDLDEEVEDRLFAEFAARGFACPPTAGATVRGAAPRSLPMNRSGAAR